MNTIAGYNELMLELFLRKRNKGEIVWRTKNGKHIPIKDLEDSHLIRIINMINRKEAMMDLLPDISDTF